MATWPKVVMTVKFVKRERWARENKKTAADSGCGCIKSFYPASSILIFKLFWEEYTVMVRGAGAKALQSILLIIFTDKFMEMNKQILLLQNQQQLIPFLLKAVKLLHQYIFSGSPNHCWQCPLSTSGVLVDPACLWLVLPVNYSAFCPWPRSLSFPFLVFACWCGVLLLLCWITSLHQLTGLVREVWHLKRLCD